MRMMKLKLLICNHKNKLTYNEVKKYVDDLKNLDTSKVDFVVCPSLPYIYNFIDYKLASQDISAYDETITGEVTGTQLKNLLINYVIIGHAERRKHLHEDKETLIRKIINANKNDIKVIYCVTEEESDLDSAKKKIKEELDKVRSYLKDDAIIAYEPMWAIGNNVELDYLYIKDIINYMKTLVNNKIIYGGSVNITNIDKLLTMVEIDGFLVSNSCLNINELQKIIEKIS